MPAGGMIVIANEGSAARPAWQLRHQATSPHVDAEGGAADYARVCGIVEMVSIVAPRSSALPSSSEEAAFFTRLSRAG